MRSSNNKCPSLDFDRFNERAIATQKFVFFFSFWLGVFVCWFMLCIALKYNNVQSHLINNWINEFSSTAPLWFWCFARDAFLFRFQHRINCLFVCGSERVKCVTSFSHISPFVIFTDFEFERDRAKRKDWKIQHDTNLKWTTEWTNSKDYARIQANREKMKDTRSGKKEEKKVSRRRATTDHQRKSLIWIINYTSDANDIESAKNNF